MYIKKLELRNFRCFDQKVLIFDRKITCILGSNGTGKTSILEALHYACYFKSFKASSPKEMIKIGAPAFSIKLDLEDVASGDFDTISIGFQDTKRLVRLNNNVIKSFKDYLIHYTTVTLTEDDLEFIKGSPERRRLFIDQFLLIDDPDYSQILKKFKKILENRNALLDSFNLDMSMYELWTNQLWHTSQEIRRKRILCLKYLESEFNNLISEALGEDFSINFEYSGYTDQDFTVFYDNLLREKLSREKAAKRSLFGAHLDDFNIIFKQKSSRVYASRGQQKLIALFIKLAQLKIISEQYSKTIFLLDDFMTDFDDLILEKVVPILTRLAFQIIFTIPSEKNFIGSVLSKLDLQIIRQD